MLPVWRCIGRDKGHGGRVRGASGRRRLTRCRSPARADELGAPVAVRSARVPGAQLPADDALVALPSLGWVVRWPCRLAVCGAVVSRVRSTRLSIGNPRTSQPHQRARLWRTGAGTRAPLSIARVVSGCRRPSESVGSVRSDFVFLFLVCRRQGLWSVCGLAQVRKLRDISQGLSIQSFGMTLYGLTAWVVITDSSTHGWRFFECAERLRTD